MPFDPKDSEDISRLRSASSDAYTRMKFQRAQRKEIIDRIAGPYYSEHGSTAPSPENNFETYVDIMKGFLVPTNPKVLIRSGERSFEETRELLELAVNTATTDAGLEETLRAGVVDALVLMSVIKVGQELADDGQTGEIFAENVSFDDFVFDIAATKWKDISFIGHRYEMEHDKFMESDNFTDKQKDDIVPSTSRYELDEIHGADRDAFRTFGEAEYTGFVKYVHFWDLYLPSFGLLVTVPVNGPASASSFVEWEGPQAPTGTGPFHILGFSELPGTVIPLSPLLTGIDLHDIANAVLWKVGQQAERAKKLLTFEGPAEEDAERIRVYPDGSSIRVDHADKVRVQTFDGPDSNVLGFQILASRKFKEKMGSLNLLGGISADSDTARQDALLDKRASARVETMAKRVRDNAQDIFRAFTWYLYRDPEKVYNIRQPIQGTDRTREINFTPEDRTIDLTRFGIEIDPFSMDVVPPKSRLSRFVQYYQQVIRPDLQLRARQGSTVNFAKFDEIASKLGNMPEIREIVTVSAPERGPSSGSGDRELQSANTTRTTVNAGSGVDEEAKSMQALLGAGVGV